MNSRTEFNNNHRATYTNRTYVHYPVNICENLLYDIHEFTSSSASSYSNYNNNYDNPLTLLSNDKDVVKYDNLAVEQSLNTTDETNRLFTNKRTCSTESRSTQPNSSQIFFYFPRWLLILCACIISLLLLFLIGLGIFLLNKLMKPVIINATVNNHYQVTNNISNITSTPMLTIRTHRLVYNTPKTALHMLVSPSLYMLRATITRKEKQCGPNKWGINCEECKPCGKGYCHPKTGQCVCPSEMFGPYCDLWRLNDKPNRGDMN
ncbi:unnamed protein product [Didymodactylos carnosus]|uniref:EGF-like domain-containing protein n=1 Tax=Didymodactylos carnosus TaxID=1234261 RepID=A0A813ZNW3_9BILA|nr:unnamed protein product [Didymodactylos carnosus]CAF1208126.1 unnamed protein product [Didymodactylos carnosus]CAF3683636.1 unnamed protein product [Didymodactylos carnosus]CAF4017309.1 unnamed protein product [Didymodactylos carnosus]